MSKNEDNLFRLMEKHLFEHLAKEKKWRNLHDNNPDELDITIKNLIIALHKQWAILGTTCRWSHKSMVLRCSSWLQDEYEFAKKDAMVFVRDLFKDMDSIT